ncbi:MAG: glycosyltransferase [candidate division Zixibacteria bacterium]|nr:glycosyltransferase [candidate division Zixibacteria bacterium]
MSQLAISFIIPVLNGEKYIGNCLEYMLREMTDTDEVIVIDNGSSDKTEEIVKSFADVRFIYNPGKTIAAQRNFAVELAKGDAFAFVDCDCLICEGWRAAVEEAFLDESVHATGSHYDVSLEPTWIEKAWVPGRLKGPVKRHYIPSGNLIIRRHAFENIGGFNSELVTDEDTDICHRITDSGGVLLDIPGARAMHEGNAKTISAFAQKERWHATSMLTSFKANPWDKPFILTLVFIASWVISISAGIVSLYCNINLWSVFLTVFFSPVVNALFKAKRNQKLHKFPQLLVLFFIYYFERSHILIKTLLTKNA